MHFIAKTTSDASDINDTSNASDINGVVVGDTTIDTINEETNTQVQQIVLVEVSPEIQTELYKKFKDLIDKGVSLSSIDTADTAYPFTKRQMDELTLCIQNLRMNILKLCPWKQKKILLSSSAPYVTIACLELEKFCDQLFQKIESSDDVILQSLFLHEMLCLDFFSDTNVQIIKLVMASKFPEKVINNTKKLLEKMLGREDNVFLFSLKNFNSWYRVRDCFFEIISDIVLEQLKKGNMCGFNYLKESKRNGNRNSFFDLLFSKKLFDKTKEFYSIVPPEYRSTVLSLTTDGRKWFTWEELLFPPAKYMGTSIEDPTRDRNFALDVADIDKQKEGYDINKLHFNGELDSVVSKFFYEFPDLFIETKKDEAKRKESERKESERKESERKESERAKTGRIDTKEDLSGDGDKIKEGGAKIGTKPKLNDIEEPKLNNIEEPKLNNIEEPKLNNIEEPKLNNIEEKILPNIERMDLDNIEDSNGNTLLHFYIMFMFSVLDIPPIVLLQQNAMSSGIAITRFTQEEKENLRIFFKDKTKCELVIKKLIQNGADINCKSVKNDNYFLHRLFGKHPLDLKVNKKMFIFLKRLNADFGAKDKEGNTPLMFLTNQVLFRSRFQRLSTATKTRKETFKHNFNLLTDYTPNLLATNNKDENILTVLDKFKDKENESSPIMEMIQNISIHIAHNSLCSFHPTCLFDSPPQMIQPAPPENGQPASPENGDSYGPPCSPLRWGE